MSLVINWDEWYYLIIFKDSGTFKTRVLKIVFSKFSDWTENIFVDNFKMNSSNFLFRYHIDVWYLLNECGRYTKYLQIVNLSYYYIFKAVKNYISCLLIGSYIYYSALKLTGNNRDNMETINYNHVNISHKKRLW